MGKRGELERALFDENDTLSTLGGSIRQTYYLPNTASKTILYGDGFVILRLPLCLTQIGINDLLLLEIVFCPVRGRIADYTAEVERSIVCEMLFKE